MCIEVEQECGDDISIGTIFDPPDVWGRIGKTYFDTGILAKRNNTFY